MMKEQYDLELQEQLDLVASIRNDCAIFEHLVDCRAFHLLPTCIENLFVKSQELVDYCIIEGD